MESIFIVTRSFHDYDSSDYLLLKAFSRRESAEELRDELAARRDRKNTMYKTVNRQFMEGWYKENPRPTETAAVTVIPKWNQKHGSKKNAPPEILAEFNAQMEKAAEASRKSAEAYYHEYMAWQARARAATRALLLEAGATQEEADAIDVMGMSLHTDDCDYEVEEIPFVV